MKEFTKENNVIGCNVLDSSQYYWKVHLDKKLRFQFRYTRISISNLKSQNFNILKNSDVNWNVFRNFENSDFLI